MVMIPNNGVVAYQTITRENRDSVNLIIENVDEVKGKNLPRLIQDEDFKNDVTQKLRSIIGSMYDKTESKVVDNVELLFQILINGILLPVILIVMSMIVFNFSPNPITLILNIIVGGFIGAKFINPVVDMITDEIDLPREKVAGFLILIDMINHMNPKTEKTLFFSLHVNISRVSKLFFLFGNFQTM